MTQTTNLFLPRCTECGHTEFVEWFDDEDGSYSLNCTECGEDHSDIELTVHEAIETLRDAFAGKKIYDGILNFLERLRWAERDGSRRSTVSYMSYVNVTALGRDVLSLARSNEKGRWCV